jgi:hypothetical protein
VLTVKQGAVTWANVVSCLASDDVLRATVMHTYFDAGHSADSFARDRRARVRMMQLLTAAEDDMEQLHPRRTLERDAICRVRRRLESEDR